MTQDRERVESSRVWQVILDIGLLIAGVAILFLYPHEITGDGSIRFKALQELIEHSDLHRGEKGIPNEYSMVGPLFSAPLYLLGRSAGTAELWCGRFNLLVLVTSVVALALMMRRFVDRGTMWRFLLLLVLATMFPRHQADYYGEVFSSCAAAVGIALIAASNSFLGWTMLVLSCVNTPATGLGLALVAAQHAWESRRYRYVLAPIIAVLLIGLEAWLRRGNPALTGYERVGGSGGTFLPYSDRDWFNHPLFFGLISVIFSMGKGIFWFHPGVIFAVTDVAKPDNATLSRLWKLWLLYLVGVVLVYSKWWCWWGGWFWGPRFFLFAGFPAALALARRLMTVKENSTPVNLLLLVAVMLSFWVGVNGLVFNQANLDVFLRKWTAHEAYMWHVPEFSVLWFPFVDPKKPLTQLDWLALEFFGVVCLYVCAPVIFEQGKRTLRWLEAHAATHLLPTHWRF